MGSACSQPPGRKRSSLMLLITCRSYRILPLAVFSTVSVTRLAYFRTFEDFRYFWSLLVIILTIISALNGFRSASTGLSSWVGKNCHISGLFLVFSDFNGVFAEFSAEKPI
jgi:hypothetical protein